MSEQSTPAAVIGRTRTRVAGQNLLAVSFLLFLVALAAVAGGLFWALTHPPRLACSLPRIDLPCPPDVMGWSPDSRELLVASWAGMVNPRKPFLQGRWKLFLVRFPERAVTPLGEITGANPRILWGAHCRPVLWTTSFVGGGPSPPALQTLFCLDGWGPGLQRREIPGELLLISPDFQRAAAVRIRFGADLPPQSFLHASGAFGTRYALEVLAARLDVFRLPSLQIEGRFQLPRSNPIRLYWQDARTLHLFTAPPESATDLEYRSGESSLRRTVRLPYPITAGKRPALTVGMAGEGAWGQAVRTWLQQHGIPGMPDIPLQQYLIVRDATGRKLRAEPLGEKPLRPLVRSYSSGPTPLLSPDEQRVALRAPDDTLRVLELSSATR